MKIKVSQPSVASLFISMRWEEKSLACGGTAFLVEAGAPKILDHEFA
jgi:hypothetical protein